MKLRTLLLALGISTALTAQEEVLFTVDGQSVTAGEFSYVYNKNREIGNNIDPKTPREYLDLYINFKLKVHEAQMLGMDTTRRFINEFEGYRNQLAKPYLTMKEVNEQVLQEAFNNMNWDVRARHIMLDLPQDALPEDTLRVYNQLMEVREQILDGDRTFESTARAISTDTYSARQGGDLGWFTAFNMVYPFEKTAYAQEEGDISLPVRTQYGYHLIQTTGRRYARGRIEVAHILAYAPQEGTSDEEQAVAKRKIEEIYEELEDGADFGQLARNHSDDKATSATGGVLPVFGMKEMLPEFEEASFALESDGDISEPFQTKIGWHIVKRIHKYDIETFDNIREELVQKIQRDSRSNLGQEVFIAQLKKDYEFTTDEDALMEMVNSVDEKFGSGAWDPAPFMNSDEVIFSFADQTITQHDFAEFLNNIQQRPRQTDNYRARAYSLSQQLARTKLIEYENSRLTDKYPEFRYLVNEYREGILLFDLTQQEVWNKSSSDSSGLAAFYKDNLDQYTVGPRYEVVRVSAVTREIGDQVFSDLQAGMSGDEVREKYNVDSELTVRVDTLRVETGNGGKLDEAAKGQTGLFGVWTEDGRAMCYKVLSIVPEGPRELSEIRGLVTSDYQGYLEKQWVESLREKYEVKVNEDVMSELESEL